MSDGPETGGAPPGQRTSAGVADTLRASPATSWDRSSGVLSEGALLEGTYRVKRLLGQGAMGAVYLVEHVALGKEFAAKIVSGSRSMDPAAVARLRNEARIASAIEHENIVSVTHLGETADGNVFVVMELLRGEDLRKRLERQLEAAAAGGGDAWLGLDEVRAIAEPVLGALAAAHQAGIVHRDLKPDNVFLSQKRGRMVPKLVDFGIGKLRSPGEGDLRLTATGQIVGTPLYMAPEQTRSGSLVDHRADIYAVGVMLFEMLCARVPFDASNFYELVIKHATEPPIDPRSIRPGLPPSVARVVLRCLEKAPDDRWQSAEAMLEAWRAAWVEAGEAVAHTLPPPPAAPADAHAGAGSGPHVASSEPRAGLSTSAPREVSIPPVSDKGASRAPVAVAAAIAIAAVIGGIVWATGSGSGSGPGAGAQTGTATAAVTGTATATVTAATGSAATGSAATGSAATGTATEAREGETGTGETGTEAGAATGTGAATVARTVVSDPPGADVFRDGARIGSTPMEIALGDAPIALELRRAGYAPATITLDASSPERVEVAMRRRPGGTKADPGAFPGLAPY